ncbi:MAG: type I 3-dehydroquinate dehydratase [Dehalococcoidales bacterium]|nr:type I 3-dehydroquinate dehydratase [Dehalococcoidales bacterium]
MKKPRICAVIVNNDLKAVREIAPLVDLFEVRIDLIGDGWQETARQLNKPWIACNRSPGEGGNWLGDEPGRVETLLQATELGAAIIDIELSTKGLDKIVPRIKTGGQCLLSYHNLEITPPLEEMVRIVKEQLKAGADISKVVTTARKVEDNISVLQLISEFSGTRLISFAMGALGYTSRVLCPLLGGELTYASIDTGEESAPGQMTVNDLTKIYQLMRC